MQTPAVIVGAGLNGLGVLRSLGREGVPCVLVGRDATAPAMRSRYARKRVVHSAESSIVDVLVSIADDYPGQRPVLFLTQENTVTTAAAHHERLAMRYRLTFPQSDVLLPLMHKDSVHRLAESAGVAVPKSVRIRTQTDIDRVDGLRTPLVVKPAERNAAYAQSFRRAYRAANHEEARELLQQILPVFADIMVQEWIEGGDSDVYFCLQYLPPDGSQPISFVGRKLRAWPPRIGGTAICTAAPEAGELIPASTAFFQYAGMTGLASLEYKRDVRTGGYVMVEPTVGRTDYQEEVATLNGMNIPFAAYCDLVGSGYRPVRSVVPPRAWRDRLSDLRSLAENPDNDKVLPKDVRIVNALWRSSDPMPTMRPLARRLPRRLKRTMTSLFKRKTDPHRS